jgi:hypothetical protein
MHAVVARETGDREAIEGSGELLAANVLPRTQPAPGVVSALWMTDGSGGTLNVLVFEDEEAARAALERILNAPRPEFLKVDSIGLYRVLARFYAGWPTIPAPAGPARATATRLCHRHDEPIVADRALA